ncbi:hypothetical protein LY78DRAFT_271321 [Colletotrichum sublineola]|nr:hypothetical protein LY78DRAFT_271321 [Colletotrichum sublineola]
MIPIPAKHPPRTTSNHNQPIPHRIMHDPIRLTVTYTLLTHNTTALHSLRLETRTISRTGNAPNMRKGNLTPKTITAPLAAFTMACILFAYTRSSIRTARDQASSVV